MKIAKISMPRVLIIEDNPQMEKLLSDCLKAEGYEVEVARTFPAAIKRVSENNIEAIIANFDGKSANALEVIKKVRKMNDEVAVFAITATTTVREACKSLKRKDDKYRFEPINIKEMRLVLSKALDEAYMSKTDSPDRCKRCMDKEFYKKLSISDGLTGLYNNIYLKEYLEREVIRAERYKRDLSLIMMDIDNFKEFNDEEGHLVGDETLKVVAKALMSSTRNVDFVARYGGEEFAIVLPETAKADAACVATRLRETIGNRHFGIHGKDGGMRLTISLGLASCPDDAFTATELIDKADKAMYKAKELGKDKVCVFGQRTTPIKERN